MSKRFILCLICVIVIAFMGVWAVIGAMEAVAVSCVTALGGTAAYYFNQETKRPSNKKSNGTSNVG